MPWLCSKGNVEQLLTVTFKRQMARHKSSYQVESPKVSKLSNQHIHQLWKLLTDYFVDAWVPYRFEHRYKEGVNTFNKRVQIQTADQKAWAANCRKLEEYIRTFKTSLFFFYIHSYTFMTAPCQKKTCQRKNMELDRPFLTSNSHWYSTWKYGRICLISSLKHWFLPLRHQAWKIIIRSFPVEIHRMNTHWNEVIP